MRRWPRAPDQPPRRSPSQRHSPRSRVDRSASAGAPPRLRRSARVATGSRGIPVSQSRDARLLSLTEREHETDGRTLAGLTVDSDIAAMQIGDMLDDTQSHAGPADLCVDGAAPTIERL